MRISLYCNKCLKDNNDPLNSKTKPLDIENDGIYYTECENGHKDTVFLFVNSFEMLFEIGMNAIVDGYSREAVTSFTSSLEIFYEFYIKLTCKKNDIDDEMMKEHWKLISKHSERQLGAYIFLYLIKNHSSPDLLPTKLVNFRNKVIHQGLIPTKDEAIKYGEKILDLIHEVLDELKKEDHEYLIKYKSEMFDEIIRNNKINVSVESYIDTTININNTINVKKPKMLNRLKIIEKYRKLLY